MPLRTPVFKTGAIPFLLQDGKYIKTADAGFEPAPLESNSSVQPLTPIDNISGNALFRPVSSQICRLKRYPMLSRTLPNRHGVSRTPIFGFGDRHATINTTRLHIFNYLFQYLNQHLQLVLIIHNRPFIVFRSCKLPFSRAVIFVFNREPGRLPLQSCANHHLIHFLILSFFLLYIFFQFFNQLTYL